MVARYAGEDVTGIREGRRLNVEFWHGDITVVEMVLETI